MKIRDFRELQCWQLADELRNEVLAICETSRVSKEFTFRDSFLDAAGSVPHNIAEGFKRFSSAEIVRFFGYAFGSLGEVQDHLQEARTRQFISIEHFDRLWDLAEHTNATALNFTRPHRERLERQRNERKHRRRQPPRPRGT